MNMLIQSSLVPHLRVQQERTPPSAVRLWNAWLFLCKHKASARQLQESVLRFPDVVILLVKRWTLFDRINGRIDAFQPSLFLISFSPSYGVPMVWNLSDNYVLLRPFFILKVQCTVKHFCICSWRKMWLSLSDSCFLWAESGLNDLICGFQSR